METELADAKTVVRIDSQEVSERLPLLREGYAAAALWDSGTSEIDVAALHQGYLRQFKTAGGILTTGAEVMEMERVAGQWSLQTRQGTLKAQTVINAAGAWADVLGQMAGAERIGLVPKRRTALMIDAPDGYDTKSLPLVIDVQEQF